MALIDETFYLAIMIRTLLFSALLLFSAFSCSKEEEVEPIDPLEGYPAPVSKVEAPETAVVNSTVPVTVFFIVNNGCGEFRMFEVEKKNNATYIKVFPKYKEQACFQALVTREVTYEFKPTEPGTYTLKFWSEYPDTYITKTIVVIAGDR